MNIDDVADALADGKPVYSGRLAWEPFHTWADVAIPKALHAFTGSVAAYSADLSAEDHEVVRDINHRGRALVEAVSALAQISGGDLEWSRKDHSRTTFPDRVAEVQREADRRYRAVAVPLRALSAATLEIARRAYN